LLQQRFFLSLIIYKNGSGTAEEIASLTDVNEEITVRYLRPLAASDLVGSGDERILQPIVIFAG
jgi:hypothetical protein